MSVQNSKQQQSSDMAQALGWFAGVVLRQIARLVWWLAHWCAATVLWVALVYDTITTGAPGSSGFTWVHGVLWLGAGFGMWWLTTSEGELVWRRRLAHFFPLVDLTWLVHGKWRLASRVMSDDLTKAEVSAARVLYKRWPDAALGVGLATQDSDGKVIAPPIMWISSAVKGLVLEITPLVGQSYQDFVERTDVLARALEHANLEVTPARNGINALLTLVARDPLAQTIEVTPDQLPLDPDKMVVRLGVDESGDSVDIKFSGSSGMVVGGVPGGGKSAAATVLTLPLLMSPLARVHIVDGKGGQDWAWAVPKAATYINDDVDLAPTLELLRSLQQQMRERLSNVASGQPSNFWARSRSESEPFEVLVIDECQSYFDVSGERDKDRKAALLEVTAIVADLVKKGRSAGFFVVLLTQKPTSESLPTKIRDNCGLRVCFRVTTSEAERAVLGTPPDDCLTRATDIPGSLVGVGVVADDRGGRKRFRALYLPEDLAMKAVNNED